MYNTECENFIIFSCNAQVYHYLDVINGISQKVTHYWIVLLIKPKTTEFKQLVILFFNIFLEM